MLTPSVSVEAGMWSRSQNDADQVYIQTALRSHVAPLMGDPLNTKIRITGVSLDRPVLSFDCSQWRIVAPSTRSPCCMCMFCFYAEAELTAHIILFGILQFSRSFAWPTAPDEDCPVWLEQHKMLVIVALIWDRLEAGAGFCLVWCYSSWCQDYGTYCDGIRTEASSSTNLWDYVKCISHVNWFSRIYLSWHDSLMWQ